LRRVAENKLLELIYQAKRKQRISVNFKKSLLFFAASLIFYSIFMFIGLMLSDYAFATDKWYWQVLTYILSIILSIVDIFITMIFPFMLIVALEGSLDG
jgi:positive regulator of sigma E activity